MPPKKHTKVTKAAEETGAKTSKRAPKKTKEGKEGKEADEQEPKKPKMKRQASLVSGVPRETLARPEPASNGLKFTSWNVNGLRGLLKGNKSELEKLATLEKPDVLFLQETKLQDAHVKDHEMIVPGYTSYWTCSQAKKGYSGSAVMIRTGLDHKVTFGIGIHEHDQEGRAVTVELDKLYVVGLYVPNSGIKLERLTYRLDAWNPALCEYVKQLSKTKPVVVTGDLNVAHLDLDIYNASSPHIKKTSGCTPQEREAFSKFLPEAGLVDTFRHLYPETKGQFTYWSTRSGARPEDRGLRLDYFLATKSLCDGSDNKVAYRLHDSYQLPEIMGSDHCPISVVFVPKK